MYSLNKALVNAVTEGEVALAKQLLARGAQVNFRNKDGETPLTFAAAWNQLEALKLLLTHGADANISDRTGGTALMLAAQHGSPEMVRALLRMGANPRLEDSAGNTALAHVDWRECARGSGEEIRRLITKAM